MTAKKNLPKSLLILVALLLIVSSNAAAKPLSRPHALDGWLHRNLITVSNTASSALTDYQVRVYLDSSNFAFANANSDGSDIRFTALDGTTLLSYWMESWTAGTNGTFWVKIPSIPANGSASIYMHYGNPAATISASNGAATFYSFEDFESTPWTAWTKEGGPGTFVQSTGQARRGSFSGLLTTDTTTGSTVFSRASTLPGTNFVQEWDLYDDMDNTAFKMVRANYQISGGQIGIGVWTGSGGSTTYYARHNTSYSYTATSAARSLGWHKMAIRVASGTADYYVDNSASLGTLTGLPATFNRVSVEGIPDGPTTYYVDDIRVRQYVSPEPTVTVGGTVTPSVDLAVVLTDSPDPVQLGGTLTYQVAVHNYGDLPATNVTVTDALPAGVTLVSATPSQGSCTGTSTITCALGGLASGGSASIAIAVTAPASPGTLTNTATVAGTETEANLANNTSTATTVVGNPVVYVVSGIDTEPYDDHQTTPQHRPFNLTNFVRSTSTYIGPVMASAFRNSHLDSAGHPFKMSWYVEMDNYINNGVYADGTPMDYLTLYNTFIANYGTEISTYGDEIAYHHHFWAWNGSAWAQANYEAQALSGPYDEHNNALDRMVLDAEFFPTNFRSGWLSTHNNLQGWVEKWMLADYSSNWSTSWVPYHPSATNYTQPGSMNHWIARCDSTPTSASVQSAFAQAASTGQPVIYCWYAHDRENMANYLNSLQTYLNTTSTSTGIPFRYATSKEAMQAVMGTTDVTPPVITIAEPTGDTYTITSDEPLWNNAPYVTARYITPSGLKYVHNLTLTPAGTNTWTTQLSDERTFTTSIPGEKYALTATATSAKAGFPASNAVDGNESTYWDSEALPQSITVDIGSTQAVPRLTVHFYDGDARTYTYHIESSIDGSTWTEIVPSTTVHGLATHDFDPANSMRYARITVTAQTVNNFAHIYEISLYRTVPSTTSETGQLQQIGAGSGDLYGNTSVATLIRRPLSDLSITKTSTPPAGRIGQNLTYVLTVTNNGPTQATGVQVTDALPAGLTWVSTTPSQGSCSGTSTVTCNLGDLASGASATVSIVVTPQAMDTYVNTATVTSTSVDAKQSNNTATLSTVVGNPIVYVVNAVDTEAFNNHPTFPQHIVFDVHNFIKGQSAYIEPLMAASFRNANVDSFGTSFKMTWYVEMDDFINNGVYANGTPMSYLTLYNTFTDPANFRDDIALWGDELAYHHHFSVWTGSAWIQSGHDHATDGQYDEHNNAIDRMILDANFFPSNFRAGWLNNSNQLQAWIEQWMIADFGGNGWGGTGWAPYHPSETSYTSVGDMDHWMVNCNGGDITSAFTQAANTGLPVIYCWYSHDRDNMPSMITSLQSSATAAAASTGIPFRYATSLEAIQAVIGTTDTTRPTLTITQGAGTTYNIASNETLWQDIPYVAARYITPTGRLAYRHLAAAPLGTNAWSVDVPATQTITTTIPPIEYAPAGVTASHEYVNPPNYNYPATNTIDGNESTYWDSTNQVNPNWISVDLGTTQPVAMATVHFYDNDGRTYTYSIDASNDGINWTEIVPSSTISGTATYSPATPVNLRYFRVNVTNNSAGTYAHIYEISLFATSTSTTLTETATLQRVGAGAVDRSGNSNVASIQGPTAVELNYFRAARASGGVLLSWETVSEATLAGFNLYRRVPGGEFIQVNSELIAPQMGGQPLGSVYTFLDEGIPLDRRYEYRLEAIETTLAAGSTALTTFWPFDVLLPVIIH